MTEFTVRAAREEDLRAMQAVMGRALHSRPLDDEAWEQSRESFLVERKFGAFENGVPIGMTSSLECRVAVPGGAEIPAGAVEAVGVRADRTRRGVVTELLTTQLRDCLDRGESAAVLHCSEPTIYGRFGYGAATRAKNLMIDKARARMRADVPVTGSVRMLSDEDAQTLPPELYQRMGLYRQGMISRARPWWVWEHERRVKRLGFMVAVHSDQHGVDDGYVLYRSVGLGTFERPDLGNALEVHDLHAANPGAIAGLWRYLLSIDLVTKIRAFARPADEPIGAMLENPRAARIMSFDDHIWLRLLDVRKMLAARSYERAEPVVIAVTDRRLPENEGSYRISADGVERVDATADLSLDVETLGMIYLGEWQPSVLAGIGRISATSEGALSRADALFRTARRPWCGSSF